MSELRRDPVGGRWVIVDIDHPSKPEDYRYEPPRWREGVCPFCYGNESMTPPEIEVIRDPGTAPNASGWQVRVVASKFPALQIEGDLERHGIGMYDMSNGVGAHEVLIETPQHNRDFSDLSLAEIENVITMYCRRVLDLSNDKRFKYLMVFKNSGPAAGASLEHPHTQIVALPMVPKNVMEEIKGANHYFEYKERCIFCDLIRQEMQEKERVIFENKYFISFCPFVSRFPFEFWIIPKQHNACFCNMSAEEKSGLAVSFRDNLAKLKKIFPSIAYNFIIHSAPVNGDGCGADGYHWHIEFVPQLTRVAGFEWGTGFYCVATPPEMAAKYLREVE